MKSEKLFDFEKSLAAELLKGAEYYYLIIDEIKEYILRLSRRLDMSEYVRLGHENIRFKECADCANGKHFRPCNNRCRHTNTLGSYNKR